MKKRIFFSALVLLMLVGILPTAVFATETVYWSDSADISWYGDGSAAEFTINTAAELAGLAKLVNEGNSFSGKTVKLGGDIDLKGNEWTPIGGENSFVGTFDGGNYTISNLKINSSSKNVGLFGNAWHAQEIKNLTVHNASVKGGNESVAVIVGTSAVKLTNCHVTGSISVEGGLKYIGGIAGYYYGTMSGCSIKGSADNHGTVKAENFAGALAGFVGENSTVSNNTVEYIDLVATGSGYGFGLLAGNANYGLTAEENTFTSASVNTADPYNITGLVVGQIAGTDKTTVIINNTIEDTEATVTKDGEETAVTAIVGANGDNSNAVVGTDVTFDTDGDIVGGTFEIAPPASALAENVTIPTEPDANGKFVASNTTTYLAQIGVTKYETLADAITAAAPGETIILLSDVTLDAAFTIDKNITLTGDKTIRRGEALTGHMITVATDATLTIDGITVDGGSAEGITAVKSMILVNGKLVMNSGVLQNNNNTYGSGVKFGGAVLVETDGSFEMNGGTIQNNTAKVGGGVDCYGIMTMTGGTITGNTASNGPGGGICNRTNPFVAENATISNNTAVGTGGAGGGVHSNPGCTLTNVTISSNTAGLGGGLYIQDANKTAAGSNITATLNNCTISNNTATGKYGGGVWCNANFVMEGGIITGNKSTNQGGGVYGNGFFTINGTITGNESRAGGGVYVYQQEGKFGGELTIQSEAVISDNIANGSMGGGVVAWNGENSLTKVTIEDGAQIINNTATSTVGGLYVNGELYMNGGTITGNKVGEETIDVKNLAADTTNIHITGGTFSSDISDVVAGTDYVPAKNPDGTWSVEKSVAQIGETKYTSLQAAMDAANTGDTVILLSNDAGLTATVTETKSVILSNNTDDEIIVRLNRKEQKIAAGETYTFSYTRPSFSGNIAYAITVEETANGSVISSKKSASKNAAVTLTVSPADGYETDTLTVIDKNNTEIELTEAEDGKYTFKMPASKVTVTATFKALTCDGGKNCPSHDFADVDTDQWYHESVDYAIKNDLMSGTNNGFEPLTTTNRAMIVTILWRLEGKPAATDENPFDDLKQDWYRDAVIWAASNKIVEGWDGSFMPEDDITREQLATILWRYAEYKGYNTSSDNTVNISDYADNGKISNWALPAMQWAVSEGILQGYAGYLSPVDGSKRCEAAAMIMRFIEDVTK